MKARVLTSRYDDGSGYKAVRVYTEPFFDKAQSDLDFMQEHASNDKDWKLEDCEMFDSSVYMLGGKVLNIENWKVGKIESTVVSNKKIKNTNFPTPPNPEESRDEEIEYYGGYLVCESIGNKLHADIISAAFDMLEFCVNVENDDGRIPANIWEMRNTALIKALKNYKV